MTPPTWLDAAGRPRPTRGLLDLGPRGGVDALPDYRRSGNAQLAEAPLTTGNPMRFAQLTLLVTFTLVLLVASAASAATDTVVMVHSRSGSRETCPPALGGCTFQVTVTQMHEISELDEEATRTGMSEVEWCARHLEILGYVREGQPAYQRYVNAVYKWSISYPPGWALDDDDPAFVKIRPPLSLPQGLVGIHSEVGVTVTSGGAYANLILDRWNRSMASQGVNADLTSRRARILDGTFVADIEHVMGAQQPRGKSRKVIGVTGEQGFVIDAETLEGSWTKLEPYFYQIIRSFTFPR